MLQNMHIKNIALIDEMDIGFEEGLNILTGETGTGKSVLIGSLGIGLGGKFNRDILRDADADGLVELLFSVEREHVKAALQDMEIAVSDEGEILISRRLSPSGRAVNRVNDVTVTTARLREIASVLIDLHAQHEQQTLLKADRHLLILDRFGGKSIEEKKEQVRAAYADYTALKKEIEESAVDEGEKSKKMDFLQYQIREIQAASLCVGEDAELEARYRRAVNAKEILSTADEIYQVTGYENSRSAAEMLGHALQQMGRLTELDQELTGLHDTLHAVDDMLSDFNRGLNRYIENMTYDGQEFAELEARLDLINSLKVKYGNSIEQIIHSCEAYEEEYNKLVCYEQYMEELQKKRGEAEKRLADACGVLTHERKEAAVRLCEQLRSALEELNFMAVQFDMEFRQLSHFTANGRDEAYFMLSTNVGEPMKPLYEVASGGELSRVMLALKSCLAYEDDTPTLVFDEIDTGISGRTAQRVAEKLSVIGRNHQVICITHLPQIASMADTHYRIEKNVENNKTISSIRKLSSEEEVSEIARLLGGVEITENTLASAREMKGLAERAKIY